MPKSAAKSNVKRARFYLTYDLDFAPRQMVIQINPTVEVDGAGFVTPITPLYNARLSKEKPLEVPKRNGFEPRQFNACFVNPENATGESNLTVYQPYRPTDPDWIGLKNELLNYDTPPINLLTYKGESQSQKYEDFVNYANSGNTNL